MKMNLKFGGSVTNGRSDRCNRESSPTHLFYYRTINFVSSPTQLFYYRTINFVFIKMLHVSTRLAHHWAYGNIEGEPAGMSLRLSLHGLSCSYNDSAVLLILAYFSLNYYNKLCLKLLIIL